MSSLGMGKAKATRVDNHFEALKEDNKIATSPPWRASSSRIIVAERGSILNDKLTFGNCMELRGHKKTRSADDSMKSFMHASEFTRVSKAMR